VFPQEKVKGADQFIGQITPRHQILEDENDNNGNALTVNGKCFEI
jgi:hypothetical protein